jgi:hypothetical protein
MTRRRIRSSICGTLAILASLAAAPSVARATCGDYVSMPQHGQPSANHGFSFGGVISSLVPMGGAARGFGEMPPPCRRCPAAPGKQPCQGPWCSDNHAPMTPPTTTSPSPHQEWALRSFSDLLDASAAIPLGFFRDHADRVHHVFPIYHPPRA